MGTLAVIGFSIVLPLGVLSFVIFMIVNEHFKKKKLKRLESNRQALSHQDFASDYFPVDIQEIAATVREMMGQYLPMDVLRTLPSDKVNSDLLMDYFDSMANVELIMDLEKRFDIEITDQEAQELFTINDIIVYVARKTKEKSNGVDHRDR